MPSMPVVATPFNPKTPTWRAMTTFKVFQSIVDHVFNESMGIHRVGSTQPSLHSTSLDNVRPAISGPTASPLPAVALQTPSQSIDSIIITSLRRAPFCCHEDLVTMPRSELVRVAQNINRCLPKALQIACGDDLHDADIRIAIEVLAGIKPETGTGISSVPILGSPRAMQANSISTALADNVPLNTDIDSSLSEIDEQMNNICSSPVATHRPRLESLKEEQEQEEPFKHGHTFPDYPHVSAGPVPTSSGSRLFEDFNTSASHLLSSDSDDSFCPLTGTQGSVHRRCTARLSSRSPQPREVLIRLPFACPPKSQHAYIFRSHSQRTATTSTSAQASALKRAKSDATVFLKRQQHHFRRGQSEAIDRIEALEAEKSRAPPIIPTRSLLVDFLTPRPHIESTFTMVSQKKSATAAGVVKVMSETVV